MTCLRHFYDTSSTHVVEETQFRAINNIPSGVFLLHVALVHKFHHKINFITTICMNEKSPKYYLYLDEIRDINTDIDDDVNFLTCKCAGHANLRLT